MGLGWKESDSDAAPRILEALQIPQKAALFSENTNPWQHPVGVFREEMVPTGIPGGLPVWNSATCWRFLQAGKQVLCGSGDPLAARTLQGAGKRSNPFPTALSPATRESPFLFPAATQDCAHQAACFLPPCCPCGKACGILNRGHFRVNVKEKTTPRGPRWEWRRMGPKQHMLGKNNNWVSSLLSWEHVLLPSHAVQHRFANFKLSLKPGIEVDTGIGDDVSRNGEPSLGFWFWYVFFLLFSSFCNVTT